MQQVDIPTLAKYLAIEMGRNPILAEFKLVVCSFFMVKIANKNQQSVSLMARYTDFTSFILTIRCTFAKTL